MGTSSKTAPKKASNSTTLKTRRRDLRSKKLHSKGFASFSRKYWEIKLRKFKLDKDLANHHALLLLANTDGQLIWNVL
jgi:hypothetical protein